MQVPVFYSHKYGSGYNNEAQKDAFGGGIINGGSYTDGPATPLFYFGHGLSYTEFEIGGLKLDKTEVDTGSEIKISCDVRNTGKRKGSEVVQIYLAVRGLPVTRPKQQLIAFEKVELNSGESAHLEFVLPIDRVGYIDSDLKLHVKPCHVEVQAGNSSNKIFERVKFEVVGKSLKYDHAQSFFTQCTVSRV
jgi:beta-glucosidase